MAETSSCFFGSSPSRGGSWGLNGRRLLLSVFSTILYLVLFLPCGGHKQFDGFQNPLLCDGCENFKHFDGTVENGSSLPGYFELKDVFFQSTPFFFPSTLISSGMSFDGLGSENKNFDANNFGSCKQPPPLNLNSVVFSSDLLSSPYVEISPSSLDWGAHSLFTPSIVYLTVGNTHNSSILHVFEPFSSDGQFYAYDFEKLSLAPGEAGSIAFVFLPESLGSVLAHVVLQTSFGGFVIHARGTAIESPYGFEPFRGFEQLSDGRLSWDLSLYNTYDDILYVKEVSARISIYSEDTSLTHHLVCTMKPYQNSFGRFGSCCKTGDREVPWMDITALKNWEVPPFDVKVIMKMNLWPPLKGNISGAFCVKLQNFTHDKFETIILPIETKVDNKANFNSLTGVISVFFESLVPWDGKGFVCTLSVRNSAPYLLSVVSITEKLDVFEVKYMEGLLLYPDTITQVALISYSLPDASEHIPPKFPWFSPDCKLSLSTNDSISPQIEIPCEVLVQTCCRNVGGSGPESSSLGQKSQEQKVTNARTGFLGSILEEPLSLESKFLELLEMDRRILENWRSQGTILKLSVLKDEELLFPAVQIGTEYSKWISVHNPSPKPVVMQLVLNSGIIIDHCEIPDDSFKSLFLKIISMESQDGFSIPNPITAEAVVHPFGHAQIGPVLFRPSKQCIWRSSALIRNNLSGVEWLPLRAFGRSRSLLLLEGSEAVKKIEFNLNLPSILDQSLSGTSLRLESGSKSCVHKLYKELYARNVGEFPLKVVRLEVSDTECGSDGFVIHDCKGFALAPGESVRLLISYQADFSAAPVQKHLKLAMDSGFLAIPMEVHLPVNLTDQCVNPFFWTALWKLPAVMIFTTVFVVCLLLFVLHSVASDSKDYSVEREKPFAVSRAEKPSRTHHNMRSARSIKKNDKLEECLAIDRYSCCEHNVQENIQKVKEKKDPDHQKKSAMQSPPPAKIPIGVLVSSEAPESPQTGNLTVKVVKDRGRRKKRRAGGGLVSKFEVSSSQSGNSTPSSPLSPIDFTSDSSFNSFGTVASGQNHKKKQEFSFSTGPKVVEGSKPQQNIGKPVLLPSATFPGTGCRAPVVTTSNLMVSSSSIAPYARAPGSKLIKEKGMKTKEDDGKQYTYDIWGNHFCGHLFGKSKELTTKVIDASEGDSQSFFTKDPQSLMTMSSALSETSGHNLTPYDVDYVHQIK